MDLRGEKVYYMPEGLPTLRGIRFLRTGLLMGELKKNRFEPSQALAMNLKKFTFSARSGDRSSIRRRTRYEISERRDFGCGGSCEAERQGMVSDLCGWISAWFWKACESDA